MPYKFSFQPKTQKFYPQNLIHVQYICDILLAVKVNSSLCYDVANDNVVMVTAHMHVVLILLTYSEK